MKPEMVPASELVEDFDLYPRKDVDSQHVSNLVEALAADVELPAIIADRKSKRITDGFHRRRAWIRQAGNEDALIPVVFKDYKTDGEMFLDAMERNSAHGRRLASFDHVRCAMMAAKLKLKPATIAAALRLTTQKIEDLLSTRTATATLQGSNRTTPVALKRTIRHMAGATMTKEQGEANLKLGGMSPAFYVNQVILLLENKLMPEDDENLNERLMALRKLLT